MDSLTLLVLIFISLTLFSFTYISFFFNFISHMGVKLKSIFIIYCSSVALMLLYFYSFTISWFLANNNSVPLEYFFKSLYGFDIHYFAVSFIATYAIFPILLFLLVLSNRVEEKKYD